MKDCFHGNERRAPRENPWRAAVPGKLPALNAAEDDGDGSSIVAVAVGIDVVAVVDAEIA